MTDHEYDSHPGWKYCTSEGARLDLYEMGLASSFREKLEWLEEAESFSLRFPINRDRAIAEGRLPPDEKPLSPHGDSSNGP